MFYFKKIITKFKIILIVTSINVDIDAITGKNLNHNWDVLIDSVKGNQGSWFLSLIWSQKIDNGYNNRQNDVILSGKRFFLYKKKPDSK